MEFAEFRKKRFDGALLYHSFHFSSSFCIFLGSLPADVSGSGGVAGGGTAAGKGTASFFLRCRHMLSLLFLRLSSASAAESWLVGT